MRVLHGIIMKDENLLKASCDIYREEKENKSKQVRHLLGEGKKNGTPRVVKQKSPWETVSWFCVVSTHERVWI